MADPRSIAAKLRDSGRKFCDESFPPSSASLYRPEDAKTLAPRGPRDWRRPSELGGGAPVALFKGGAGAGDVRQGQLGDCWLLGAMACVATREELISAVFPFHDAEVGLYVVRVYKGGEWREVVVDDRIPVAGGKPAYASAGDPTETWVAMLEKGYAKLHGCYQNLEGGSSMQGMVDLTGGAGEKIKLNEPRVREAIRSGALWRRLMRYDDSGHLLGCAHAAKDGAIEKDRGLGIMSGHAYSILQVEEVANGKHKLLRVRNPWGEGEWKGRWSDGSAEWTRKIKEQLNYEFADDGTFWIEFDDFLRQFNKIHVCRLYEDSIGARWSKFQVSSEWKDEAAGGCMNHASWTENPQWGVQLKPGVKRSRAFVSIAQPDVRLQGATSFSTAIGFYVLRARSLGRKKASASQEDIVFESAFSFTREVSTELNFTADSYYVIVPATYEAGQDVPFTLTVYTEQPAAIAELGAGPTAKVSGKWAFSSAGGCPSHLDSWPKNPMYTLLAAGPTQFHVVLSQPPVRAPKQPNALGFQIYDSAKGARLAAYAEPLAQSEYIQGGSVSATFNANPDQGPVVIVPSTFLPMKTGSFTLKVSATAPFIMGPSAARGEAWEGVALAREFSNGGAMRDGQSARWYASGRSAEPAGPAAGDREKAPPKKNPTVAAITSGRNRQKQPAMDDRRFGKQSARGDRRNGGGGGAAYPAAPSRSSMSSRSSASSASSMSSRSSVSSRAVAHGEGVIVQPAFTGKDGDEEDLAEAEDYQLRALGVDKERNRAGRATYGKIDDADEGMVREAISYNLWSRVNPGFTVEPIRSVAQESFQYDPEEARRVRVASHNRVKNDYTEFVEVRARQNNLNAKGKK